MGTNACQLVTTAIQSVCIGSAAGGNITTSSDLTAVGFNAAKATTNSDITAIGYNALLADTNASNGQNTCVGSGCGNQITTGATTSALGYLALNSMVNGSGNTAMGWKAAQSATGSDITAFGYNSCGNVSGGSNDTCLGFSVGGATITTASNDVLIGTSNACVPSSATVGNELDLCAGSAFLVRITGGGTPSTAAASFSGTLALPSITTGTNADFVCMTSGLVFVIQASSCTISSLRFKENVVDITDDVLPKVLDLRVASYNLKAMARPNRDNNFDRPQLGLIAENIAEVFPLCSIYERDLKTPKSYRPECIGAMLVKGEQEIARNEAQAVGDLKTVVDGEASAIREEHVQQTLLNASFNAQSQVVQRQQWEIYGLAVWCFGLTAAFVIRRRRA
jgi:hypothetical protein